MFAFQNGKIFRYAQFLISSKQLREFLVRFLFEFRLLSSQAAPRKGLDIFRQDSQIFEKFILRDG